MQAITTRYVPATDRKGARVSASCAMGTVFIPYPSELSGMDTHGAAAMALVRKLKWENIGLWHGAELGTSGAYVFVPTLHGSAYKSTF